jgi:hypothetical protein
MTPQEKAKELYIKMLNWQSQSNLYLERNIICPMAIECALIAVGELLSETEERDGMRVINNPYWLEVRNEIEKL